MTSAREGVPGAEVLSMMRRLTPRRASQRASINPVGPAPTIRTSVARVTCFPCRPSRVPDPSLRPCPWTPAPCLEAACLAVGERAVPARVSELAAAVAWAPPAGVAAAGLVLLARVAAATAVPPVAAARVGHVVVAARLAAAGAALEAVAAAALGPAAAAAGLPVGCGGGAQPGS